MNTIKLAHNAFVAVVTLLLLISCNESRNIGKLTEAKPVDSLSVATIFKDLGVELQDVKKKIDTDTSLKVEITEADLVLDNIVTEAASGTLTLLIFNPSYTYTGINEQTVTFSLLSVDKSKLPKASIIDFRGLNYKFTLGKTETLSDLIYSTARTLNKVPLILDDSPTKITQKKIEIDIKFSIDRNYGLELKATVLKVGVDAKGSYDDANAQTLKVVFTVKGKH